MMMSMIPSRSLLQPVGSSNVHAVTRIRRLCFLASLLGNHHSRIIPISGAAKALQQLQYDTFHFFHPRRYDDQYFNNIRHLYCNNNNLKASSRRCHQHHHQIRSYSKNNDIDENANSGEYYDFLLSQKKQRTWKRLRHLVDMAVDVAVEKRRHKNGEEEEDHNANYSNDDDTKEERNGRRIKNRSVVDVGTDHGLLALALAGKFENVLGVDVSQQALQDGALSLMEQIRNKKKEEEEEVGDKEFHSSLSLDNLRFRYSDGLNNISIGEADVVCIAGMGPNTMLKILFDYDDDDTESLAAATTAHSNHLDRLDCQQLILQPTNSRPKFMVPLYDQIQLSGNWILPEERIENLNSRWYITSSFVRSDSKQKRRRRRKEETTSKDNDEGGEIALPGSKIVASRYYKFNDGGHRNNIQWDEYQRNVWKEYVAHHVQWIKFDAKAAAAAASGGGDENVSSSHMISDADRRWLKVFDIYE